jgi:hypothetical protein
MTACVREQTIDAPALATGGFRGRPVSRTYEVRVFGRACSELRCKGRVYEGELVSNGTSYTRFHIEHVCTDDTLVMGEPHDR